MLNALLSLASRLRQPASRARELRELQRRLLALPDQPASPAARELALRLRELRVELSSALQGDLPCSSCSTGCSSSSLAFAGGDCCEAGTAEVFSDEELAALSLAGTRVRDLRPPHGEHRGCAFRSETSCTLDPAHRPSICVLYACRQLKRSLLRREDAKELRELFVELAETLEAFARVRGEAAGSGLAEPARDDMIPFLEPSCSSPPPEDPT